MAAQSLSSQLFASPNLDPCDPDPNPITQAYKPSEVITRARNRLQSEVSEKVRDGFRASVLGSQVSSRVVQGYARNPKRLGGFVHR